MQNRKELFTLLGWFFTISSVVLMTSMFFGWESLMDLLIIRIGSFYILTSLVLSLIALIMAFFSKNKWKLALQLINFSLVIMLACINIMALGFNEP
ncbi:hypothetical protein [Oceanobacillus sp. 1P07AA]|uniref:hypothetical protein n=1 Tax=Oceanobacillus sp. 1P07AA TaxID=3132293 RepID=UPI0039A55BAC